MRTQQGCKVGCNVGHTSVAGVMKVIRKVHGSNREARWHRELNSPSLIVVNVKGGLFYCLPFEEKGRTYAQY